VWLVTRPHPIKQLIAAGKNPTRALMIAAVQNIQYDGLTGHISFDQNGDNAGTKVFSIYKVVGEQWEFLKEVNA
jgi:branched-chain amino acid transport system substrate-binding protein